MKSAVKIFVVTQVAMLLGCATEKPESPPQPQSAVSTVVVVAPPAPQSPKVYSLDEAVRMTLDKMQKNQLFLSNYNLVKSAKGRLPIATVGKVENRTTLRIQNRLNAVQRTVTEILFDTALFKIENDEASVAILSRIIRGRKSGLDDNSLVQSLGNRTPPDFIVLGELCEGETVDGAKTYKLRISLHNLSTGNTVWEGSQDKVVL